MEYQDTLKEYQFIDLQLAKKIPASVYVDNPVDKFDFAGRSIEVSGACQWMNVNVVQCPRSGEMNWALHENMEAAQKAIDNQFHLTKSRDMSSIISEETVDVVFEGKATKAKKVLLKVKVPKFVTGGSNELIIYYVAEEIRGRFMSCVLSHYSDERLTENGVPGFLSMFLKVN